MSRRMQLCRCTGCDECLPRVGCATPTAPEMTLCRWCRRAISRELERERHDLRAVVRERYGVSR